MIKVNFAVKDRQIYKADSRQVSIPTVSGMITVLSGHIPLVTVIQSGELTIVDHNGRHLKYAITRGVANIKSIDDELATEVILLCDDALASEDIDLIVEEEAIARAEEVIANGEVFEDISGLVRPLERELNRIRIDKRRN